jgi:D-alanyl-D-alanine carboxypeptidase
MKFSISTTLVLLLTLLTVQASPSSTNEGLFIRSATQEIDRIAREDGFSGTVLFARNGISILRIAEGLQDRQRQLPNRIDTKFPIESDTKQFTAAAILLLEQEGRLKLTDSISVYYPDMPPALVPITIAQLLTHSSGIVDCKSCGDADFLGYKDYVATSLQTNLAFQPGTGMLYSNAGYGLLAIAIEKVSGLSYAKFLQQHFFSPLRLTNSGDGKDPEMMAHGYFCPSGLESCQEGTGANLEKMAGFNGVYSTVGDMLRWTRDLKQGALLSARSRQEMFQDYGHGYGFGWYLSEKLGRKVIWHTGNDGHAGYSSIVEIFPDDQVTVIALANNTGLSHGKATLTIDGKPVTIPASPAREVVEQIERTYFDSGAHQ